MSPMTEQLLKLQFPWKKRNSEEFIKGYQRSLLSPGLILPAPKAEASHDSLSDNMTVALCSLRDMIKLTDQQREECISSLMPESALSPALTVCTHSLPVCCLLGSLAEAMVSSAEHCKWNHAISSLRHIWGLARLFPPFTEGKTEDPIID